MLSDFKQFVLKGNVVDLAVAVVVGAAFTGVVNGFVTDLLNPALAAIVGKPDFSALVVYAHGGKIQLGLFLNAVLQFVLVAGAVYVALVMPMRLLERRMHPPAPPQTKLCPECISEVNVLARRCAHCGVVFAEIKPTSAG